VGVLSHWGLIQVQEAVAKALEVAAGKTDGQEAIDYVAYVDWMMGKDAK